MRNQWQKRLKNVTWGYRDKFLDILTYLEEKGYLNTDKKSNSYQTFNRIFNKIISKNDRFDEVLHEFLLALKNIPWIISRPELMEDWGNYGLHLLEDRWYYARKFFHLCSEDNFNIKGPEELRFILTSLRSLEQKTDIETVLAFLTGYRELRNLLSREQIQFFIEEGLAIFNNNKKTAQLFFKLELFSAEKAIKRLKTDCTLDFVKERMKRLTRSFCDKDLEINNFSGLDSDELLEKGSELICLYDGLYLPQRVSLYDNYKKNQNYYLAITYVTSLCYIFNGFSLVHGYSGYESGENYLYNNNNKNSSNIIFTYNLFYLTDLIRILNKGMKTFPRFEIYLRELIKIEYQIKPLYQVRKDSIFEKILYRVLHLILENRVKDTDFSVHLSIDKDKKIKKFYQQIKKQTLNCRSFQDVYNILPELSKEFKNIFGNEQTYDFLRSLSFFPDYRYRVQLSNPSREKLDLKNIENDNNNKSDRNSSEDNKEDREQAQTTSGEKKEEKEKKEDSKNNFQVGYFYDEWNREVQDYHKDWCCLKEIHPEKSRQKGTNININDREVNKVKRVFERLKPELMEKEKNLSYGDEIEIDSLIRYLIEKEASCSSRAKVYSKYYKNERDIAFLLLIDVSGSTGEKMDEGKVLEVEKKAAFTMAEGLKRIGDKFGIFGFSGNGRNNCRYYIYKDFKEKWGESQKQKLYNTRPDSSTRIGVAIRHSMKKIKKVKAKKKIIIVITDGKPQDNEYSSDSQYAQYDVRKACLEALAESITVIGLSTKNNSLADLEIMFPEKRYLIIQNMKKIPEVLTQFYVRITA